MASPKERVSARAEAIRRRRPFVDHVVRGVEHYGVVNGNLQAGAVTYFAFLSVFPILALAFFAVGWIARVYPDAQDQLVKAIDEVLPGMVSETEEPGKISLESIEDSAAAVGLLGLLGVLYSGLGWLSGMRDALLVVFETPQREQPGFLMGKAKDLVSLVLIGLVLVVSVAMAGVVKGLSEDILDLLGLGSELSPVLTSLTIVVGIGANMLLFFALFKLLAAPETPAKSLWSGALVGAIGFEVLKQLSTFLIGVTREQPAFQAFGIALILVVWINYFSRVVMYAAAWAHTSRDAREARAEVAAVARADEPTAASPSEAGERVPAPVAARRRTTATERLEPGAAFALGGGVMLGLVALARRFSQR